MLENRRQKQKPVERLVPRAFTAALYPTPLSHRNYGKRLPRAALPELKWTQLK
jgi:hypothetical protein